MISNLFYHRGIERMVIRLFLNVKYHELAGELENVKELNFSEANIWLDTDNKKMILDTDNGRADIIFDDYGKLLDAVIRIGRALFFNDVLDSLNRARDQLTLYRRYPELEMEERMLIKLISEIEKAKEDLIEKNFTLKIKLGDVEVEDVESFINDHPETKKAIEDGIEMYRELCWKTYEDDDPDYCDRIFPMIYISIYAVPEDKRIIEVVNIDQVGEVYETVKVFDDPYSFLKAFEEYGASIVAR